MLARQLYAVPFAMLDLGAFAWYGLLAFAVGVSMPAQVTISVITSSLAIAALAVLAGAIGWRHGSRGEALLGAAAVFTFAAGSSFLHVFSALGPHNVAILMLVLMVAVSERWLGGLRRADEDAARGAGVATLLLYSLTLFTYHGGTLLAPPVLALTLLAANQLPLARRLKGVAGLVLWTLVLLLPLGVVTWVSAQADYIGSPDQGIVAYIKLALSGGESGAAAMPVPERARLWFAAQSDILTPAGLVLGLGGLLGLAALRGVRAPLILALVHFACGVAVPSFTQYDRTSAYLVPFLCLGAGWLIAAPAAALIERRRLWALPVLGLALLLGVQHAIGEAPRLREPGRVAGWQFYLSRQGDWAPTQAEIEARLPDGAVLIPWDYQVSHLYNSFRRAGGGGPRLYVPLSTLRDRQADGSLADYRQRRRLALAPGLRLFLLVPASEPPERLAALAAEVGLATTITLRPVARWEDKAWPLLYPALVLYELPPAP